jgi:hypothetical protein
MTLNTHSSKKLMLDWTRHVLGRVGRYAAKAAAVTLGVVATGLPPAARD